MQLPERGTIVSQNNDKNITYLEQEQWYGKRMLYIAQNMKKLLFLCMVEMDSTGSTSRLFDVYLISVLISS